MSEDWPGESVEMVRAALDELFGTAGGCHDDEDALAVIEAVTKAHPAWFQPRVLFGHEPPSL